MKTAKILKIALALAAAGTITAIILNKTQSDEKYWHGEYYNNENLEGPVFAEEDVEEITHNWQGQPPKPGMNNYLWSARWKKKHYFKRPFTRFTIRSDYGTRVYIDDILVIDNWISHYDDKTYTTELTGMHTVTIEYWSKYNSGNSWLKLTMFRQEEFSLPPDSESIIRNGDFSQGMTSWGKHGCADYAHVIEVDGKPTLHFDSHPPDDCWVEAWNCDFPRVHPGDTIIVYCKVRTGPENPPPHGHHWAGIGFDLRAIIDGQIQSAPITEIDPARIVSQEWIEEYWIMPVPLTQQEFVYPDQKFFFKGIPDKINFRFRGHGRNNIIPIGSPMPDEMTLCIWTDLGYYNTVEWAEYQDVKVWIIPREQ